MMTGLNFLNMNNKEMVAEMVREYRNLQFRKKQALQNLNWIYSRYAELVFMLPIEMSAKYDSIITSNNSEFTKTRGMMLDISVEKLHNLEVIVSEITYEVIVKAFKDCKAPVYLKSIFSKL